MGSSIGIDDWTDLCLCDLSCNERKCSNSDVLMVLGVWVMGTAAKIFTPCDRIKESNCIFLSQYIELLRRLRHHRLLDTKLVDIKPYVLLLQRLSSKLVQCHPKNDNTRVPICIHPRYCLINEHLHFCPYAFLKNLGEDLSYTNKVILGLEDPDDVELQVTQDLDMCTDNLQRVVDLLQRRHEN